MLLVCLLLVFMVLLSMMGEVGTTLCLVSSGEGGGEGSIGSSATHSPAQGADLEKQREDLKTHFILLAEVSANLGDVGVLQHVLLPRLCYRCACEYIIIQCNCCYAIAAVYLLQSICCSGRVIDSFWR